MKQTMKRLGALGLALLLGTLGSVPALAAELPEKDEVIYVNLSPEGEAGAIYVVNSYDLPAETTVTDYGNYHRVKNLTTTAPLTQEGKKITFTAPAGKFYYQGELDSARTGELPWRVAVRYFLDGKETPGQELAGTSGRLEMRVSLRQNPEADPVWRDNYALQTTILLDTESCKNIVAALPLFPKINILDRKSQKKISSPVPLYLAIEKNAIESAFLQIGRAHV